MNAYPMSATLIDGINVSLSKSTHGYRLFWSSGRNHRAKDRSGVGSGDSELLQRLVRAAFPLRDHRVAQVLQVGNPHLARPESRGGEVAEAVEEGDAGRERGLRLRRPCDVIEHRGPLSGGAVEERLVESELALVIDPGEAAPHRGLPRRLVGHHEVHELPPPPVRPASPSLTFRTNHTDQPPHGPV